MEVTWIELPDFCQPAPISNDQFAISKVHCTRGTEFLQGAVDRGHCHAKRFSELSKGNGRLSCILIRQAGCARPIEQLAEPHPSRHGLALLLVMASRKMAVSISVSRQIANRPTGGD